MTLSLFGAFKAGRRKFLHSSMAVTLALPLSTKVNTTPVLELDGISFGPPKFKLGDRVGHEWILEDWGDKTRPHTSQKIYQEGLIIGYFPNCAPETFYQKRYAGQWAYHIYWLTSNSGYENDLGIEIDLYYFEDELNLVSPASVSMGV